MFVRVLYTTLFITIVQSVPVLGDECGCSTERLFEYTHNNPESVPYMELYYWHAIQATKTTSIDDGVEICKVTIAFVVESSYAAEKLKIMPDDAEQIFFNGEWLLFEDFETIGRETNCFEGLGSS